MLKKIITLIVVLFAVYGFFCLEFSIFQYVNGKRDSRVENLETQVISLQAKLEVACRVIEQEIALRSNQVAIIEYDMKEDRDLNDNINKKQNELMRTMTECILKLMNSREGIYFIEEREIDDEKYIPLHYRLRM